MSKFKNLIGKISYKQAATWLALPILIFMAAVVNAPVAKAHYGDWWTQYQRTYERAGIDCYNAFNNPPYNVCNGARYGGSAPYGEHSRQFFYKFYHSGATQCLIVEYRIGHDYVIFNTIYHYYSECTP